MASETILTVVGNLTGDPEIRFLDSGAAMAKFTIASTPRTYDKTTSQWTDGEAMFLACTAWRQLAENTAESLTKGTRVVVTGRLRQTTGIPPRVRSAPCSSSTSRRSARR